LIEVSSLTIGMWIRVAVLLSFCRQFKQLCRSSAPSKHQNWRSEQALSVLHRERHPAPPDTVFENRSHGHTNLFLVGKPCKVVIEITRVAKFILSHCPRSYALLTGVHPPQSLAIAARYRLDLMQNAEVIYACGARF